MAEEATGHIADSTPIPPTPLTQMDSEMADLIMTDLAEEGLHNEWAHWMRWDGQETHTTANLGDDDSQPSSFKEEVSYLLAEKDDASNIDKQQDTVSEDSSPPLATQVPELSPSLHAPSQSPDEFLNVSQPRISSGSTDSDRFSLLDPNSSRKRKSLSDDHLISFPETEPDVKWPVTKKRPHNVIEKRYRANLNEKIAELRDSVPSLRLSTKGVPTSAGNEEEPEGPIPASKLNKASVLSKATQYIHHLELRNRRLDEENIALKTRLRTLEKTTQQRPLNITSRDNAALSDPQAEPLQLASSHGEDAANASVQTSRNPPQGLIQVPENVRRLRTTVPQPHYANQQMRYQNLDGSKIPQFAAKRGRGKFPTKFMLGSLAGLMVMEGFSSRQKAGSNDRGLFGFPIELFNYRLLLPWSQYLQATLLGVAHARLFPLLRIFLLLTILAFVVFLYLFNSRPRDESCPPKAASQSVTSSSMEVRRQAWLTSIQTVRVPRHNLFPEFLAVTLEWLKYSARLVVGWPVYSRITGRTEEHEIARVKAWDIAIDAQLAGGDAELSRSRLVLTIFASGTLPRTPARLMMKALHTRILLWRVGYVGSITSRIASGAAMMVARHQWKLARQMQHSLTRDHPEALPDHLTSLVMIECDDVLADNIVQRMSNLSWNRQTKDSTESEHTGMKIVVEDFAIHSPLDALAAWWSSLVLQKALVSSFESSRSDEVTFRDYLELALATAPPASAAYTRALVTKAIFYDERRVPNIQAVLSALPPPKRTPSIEQTPTNPMSNFFDSPTPVSVQKEVSLAVRCAMIIAMLKTDLTSSTTTNVINLLTVFPINPSELSTLSFVSTYQLLHIISNDNYLHRSAQLKSLASTILDYMHLERKGRLLNESVISRIEKECSLVDQTISRRRESSRSNDTGYASQCDEEEVEI